MDSAGASPDAGPPRLVSADLAASLERFNDPKLLAEGKVTVISLEAVEQRFGRRWSLRQDQVYEFADRVLERGVGVNGTYLRVSPTDYLIIHTDRQRLASQAACLRYLREILHHFLGAAHMADLAVFQVKKINATSLEAEFVDIGAADQSDSLGGASSEDVPSGDASSIDASPNDGPSAAVEADMQVDHWSRFVAGDGRTLRVSAKLQPVYELKRFSHIGFRMMRRVLVVGSEDELSRTAVAKLPSADILRIDLATIARALGRLSVASAKEQPLSLILPLSYVSLASQRGRTEVLKLLREASGMLRCGVICEICDIDGVPSGSLLSTVSLIRPFTLLVVGQLLRTDRRTAAALRDQDLNAVTIECPSSLTDDEFTVWAMGAIAAAKRATRSVIVYGVETPRRAAELGLIGATHVSVDLH